MSIFVPGLRGTGDWGTDERPKSFRETILWLEPDGTAPLTALMGMASTESVNDPEFSWWEEKQEQIRLKVDGVIADGIITDLVVEAQAATGADASTGGLSVIPGEFLMVEDATGAIGSTEILQVVSVTDDTNLVISRGAQDSTPAAIADDSYLVSIGTAFSEGSGGADSVVKNPTKQTNFCQIFKTAFEITETAKLTKVRTGDPIKNDKRRKMFDHAAKMEYAYIFGRSSETTGANGKPLRTTGGILSFITTNVTVFDGSPAFTEDNFIDAISPVFDFAGEGASNTRICFCGNQALTNLNKLARDSTSSRINFDSVIELFGMKLQRWILPQGELLIKTHPLFNTHPVYTKSMIGLNMKGMIDRTLRSTKFKDNIQLPDDDFQKGQWLTESGLEFHHEQTHFYLANMV